MSQGHFPVEDLDLVALLGERNDGAVASFQLCRPRTCLHSGLSRRAGREIDQSPALHHALLLDPLPCCRTSDARGISELKGARR